MKKAKWISVILVLTVLVSLLAGCGSKEYAASVYREPYEAAEEMLYDAAAPMVQSSKAMSGDTNGSSPAQSLPQNRKWVITMNVHTETEDLDAALAAVDAKIHAAGGYVEGQNITNGSAYSSRRVRSASLTVRVPADQVDSFMQEVSGVTNVTSSSRNVRDITLAYTDTEGRLNALKTEQTRLLELMEKAEDMSDLLVIEERLTEVRYQLESYSSTLRLYDNQVDYATIDLYITEVEKFTPAEERGIWERITDGLSENFEALCEGLLNFAVWFIVSLPYLLVWGLVIFCIVIFTKRRIRKYKARKAAKAAEKKD